MSSSERMPTNLRPLLILEALGESSSPMTPTEIGRAAETNCASGMRDLGGSRLFDL